MNQSANSTTVQGLGSMHQSTNSTSAHMFDPKNHSATSTSTQGLDSRNQSGNSMSEENTHCSQGDTPTNGSPGYITTNLIQRITRSEGLYIEAHVEGIPLVFALDTGASKTIISRAVFMSIPENIRPVLKKTTGLTGASGRPLGHYGTAMFSLKIGSVGLQREIVVADIEDEGLLGHDVLQSGDAHIHVQYNKKYTNLYGGADTMYTGGW